jgi:hypothetical protein
LNRSVCRYYSFTHYVNVTNRQAVRIGKSPSEMIQWVKRYLDDRSLDAEGRRQVVVDQQFTDGQASGGRPRACSSGSAATAVWPIPPSANRASRPATWHPSCCRFRRPRRRSSWIRDAARRLAVRDRDVHVVKDHGDGATERSVDGVQPISSAFESYR